MTPPPLCGTWIELFDQAGYRTLATTDPRLALPLLSSLPVDLAILDYFMPVLDGGMLANSIRERHSLPIVIASNAVAEVPVTVTRAVNAVIAKQDGLGALLRVVQTLLPPPIGSRPPSLAALAANDPGLSARLYRPYVPPR